MSDEQTGSEEIANAINNVAEAIKENNRILGIIADLLESMGSCIGNSK